MLYTTHHMAHVPRVLKSDRSVFEECHLSKNNDNNIFKMNYGKEIKELEWLGF